MGTFYKHKRAIVVAAGLLTVMGIVYVMMKEDITDFTTYLVNKDTHPMGLIVLFILLPMVGFPIIPFLILLGVKFGVKQGILILFGGVVIHLGVSFLLAHSFLRPTIVKYARKKNIKVPQIPEHKIIGFSFIFMAVPGLSYAMKNYLLPLSGISFRYHIIIGFLTQGTLGIPFIVAGHAAAGRSFLILAVILLFVSFLYIFSFWLKRKKPEVLPMEKDQC